MSALDLAKRIKDRQAARGAEQPSMIDFMADLTGKPVPQAIQPLMKALTIDEAGEITFGDTRLTRVGLVFPDYLIAQSDAEALLNILLGLDGSLAWMLGDMLVEMERSYGITYQKIAEATGRDTETLHDYKAVASYVKMPLRNGNLSWSHHRAVAYLLEDDQEYWLKMAESQGWSVAKLRAQIADASRTVTIENPVQRFVKPETLKTLRRMSKLTPEKIAKLKPGQIKEFRKIWDEATKEFGQVYVALIRRDEAMQQERDRKYREAQ